jgi:hypothetical protein
LSIVCRGDPLYYVQGFKLAFADIEKGRSSFALGRYSLGKMAWYFPAAMFFKTPSAVLIFAIAGIFSLRFKTWRDRIAIIFAPIVYFAAAFNSSMQIGYRHIMPIMPFMAILSGLGFTLIKSGIRNFLGIAAICVILLPSFITLYMTHPYYLAYFNEFAGGSNRGYLYFVDSNLDWGQDIKTLADYLKKKGNPPIILSYFGASRPEYYHIKYSPLGTYMYKLFNGTSENICEMKDILIAVSATNLQGVYYPDKQTFAWLKERKPEFVAGYSIFLYNITADKSAIEKLAELLDRDGRNSEADCLYSRAAKL